MTNAERRNYLYARATRYARNRNKSLEQVRKIVGNTMSVKQLLELSQLLSDLGFKDSLCDETWNDYSTFCENNNYKVKDIHYAE